MNALWLVALSVYWVLSSVVFTATAWPTTKTLPRWAAAIGVAVQATLAPMLLPLCALAGLWRFLAGCAEKAHGDAPE